MAAYKSGCVPVIIVLAAAFAAVCFNRTKRSVCIEIEEVPKPLEVRLVSLVELFTDSPIDFLEFGQVFAVGKCSDNWYEFFQFIWTRNMVLARV